MVTNTVHALLAASTADVVTMSELTSGATMLKQLSTVVIRPGVRYRAIIPDAARTSPALRGYLHRLSAAGADVRTMPHVPMELLVIDGNVAVFTAGTRSSNKVLATRLPSVVTTATELFERIWLDAVPLTATCHPGRSTPTRREREMLRLLAVGVTDEVAAAHLGCSVRTVRRQVAQLMYRLGARSRFQAGVKASARGWLVDQIP